MAAELASLWQRYPAAARPLMAPRRLGNAGGLSGATLWRFESSMGPLVARGWPPARVEESRIERLHGWLARAARLTFVPVPIAALDGRTAQRLGGRFWEISPWLPGNADLDRPPAEGHLRNGFSGLAAFHQALATESRVAVSPGLARRVHEIRGLLAGDLRFWRERLRQSPPDSRRDLALRWLDLAALAAPRVLPIVERVADRAVATQPCLRDVRPEHLLFDGDRLSGLVDFGAMDVDTPAGDLARLLLEWVGPSPPACSLALRAYEGVRPLGAADAGMIEAFEAAATVLVGGHWLRWHFVDGREFEDPDAVRKGLERGVQRCAEWLERGSTLGAGSREL